MAGKVRMGAPSQFVGRHRNLWMPNGLSGPPRRGARRPRLGALAALVVSLAPAAPALAQTAVPQLFESSDKCMACHNGLLTPAGEDVSIGDEWQSSMMANAARDPYWQAAVRRETIDHPSAQGHIQAECSTCHMPMAHYQALAARQPARAFAMMPRRGAQPAGQLALAADGASCTVCHQILAANLGERETFVGRFEFDRQTPIGRRQVFGPFDVDRGTETVMSSASGFVPARGDHLRSSELCATCHTLITEALGPDGKKVGELPEQVPYLEWLNSSYRDRRGCIDCHMPVINGPVAVTSVLPKPRPWLARHAFRGGNAFMLRVLSRYSAELAVQARPTELTRAASETEGFLRTAAAKLGVGISRAPDGRLQAVVTISNLAGHKLPTAYPSRRVWLRLRVMDAAGRVHFESGAFNPNGAIIGNDNDRDARDYEPHHERITSPEEVQIYEAILVSRAGETTTGLLTAVGFAKDNRILPDGFDKAGAGPEVAVHGRALEDTDFADGRDTITYLIPTQGLTGTVQVEAWLLYQPIAYRWAENLAGYTAPETRRFVAMYRSLSPTSVYTLDHVQLGVGLD